MRAWPRLRRVRCQAAAPDADVIVALDRLIYHDGTYLISELGEARTWAVYDRGRWGVVYEWLGQQRVAGWVSAEQIPLEVRVEALRTSGDSTR